MLPISLQQIVCERILSEIRIIFFFSLLNFPQRKIFTELFDKTFANRASTEFQYHTLRSLDYIASVRSPFDNVIRRCEKIPSDMQKERRKKEKK